MCSCTQRREGFGFTYVVCAALVVGSGPTTQGLGHTLRVLWRLMQDMFKRAADAAARGDYSAAAAGRFIED